MGAYLDRLAATAAAGWRRRIWTRIGVVIELYRYLRGPLR